MLESGAIVFIVFGSVGFAFGCYVLVDKLIINQMNRHFNTVHIEPDTEETKCEDEDETKCEKHEEIRGSNFV